MFARGARRMQGPLAAMIGQVYDRHYIDGQGSLDGLMFYAIPAHASPDGVEKVPQLTKQVWEKYRRECARGVGPRQTSSLWNIGPTGRCFKTNPQHARPLSGANFSSGVRKCVSSGGPTPADLWSPRRARATQNPRVEEGGRSSWSWHLCMCKTNPPGGGGDECGAEEVGWLEGLGRTCHLACLSLTYAVTAKAVRN